VTRPFCCSLFLLLRAQKKKQEKGTPASPGPTGFPCFSTRAGRGKTRASPSNSRSLRLPPASFSAPACEARQDKWGGEEENSHWHAAEHRRGCRKGDLHCLRRKPSLQSPGSIEERRASRLRRDQGHRGPFLWFVSLGKQRNERTDFIASFPAIPEKTLFKPPKATAVTKIKPAYTEKINRLSWFEISGKTPAGRSSISSSRRRLATPCQEASRKGAALGLRPKPPLPV